MSGYVLTQGYFKENRFDILTSNAARRYVRLSIPIFVSVLFVYICMKLSLFYNQEAAPISYSNWWLGTFWRFDTNILDILKYSFYSVFISANDKYNTVLWTMHYEFIGSFFVFAIAALFGNMKYRYIFYFLFAIFLFNTYYLAFLFGLVLADLFKRENRFIEWIGGKTLLVIFIALIGLFFGSVPTGIPLNDTLYSFLITTRFQPFVFYHIIGATLFVFGLLASKILKNFFSWKAFKFLGRISFSMYLTHTIVIGSVSSFIFVKLSALYSYSTAVIISIVISTIFILTLAIVMTKYIDDKSVSLSKITYNKWFRDKIK